MEQEVVDILKKLVNRVFVDHHPERDAMLATLDKHSSSKGKEPEKEPEPQPTYEELLVKHKAERQSGKPQQ